MCILLLYKGNWNINNFNLYLRSASFNKIPYYIAKTDQEYFI